MTAPRRFSAESVARALDLHMPGRWRYRHGGYELVTATGVVRLGSLAEAFAFTLGCSEANHHNREA